MDNASSFTIESLVTRAQYTVLWLFFKGSTSLVILDTIHLSGERKDANL